VKNEAILAAEVQSACFLFDSFSFARAKEKRIRKDIEAECF